MNKPLTFLVLSVIVLFAVAVFVSPLIRSHDGFSGSALIVPSGPNDSRVTATKKSLVEIANAVNAYFKDCGKYPADLEELTRKFVGCRIVGEKRYLDGIPKDGYGDTLTYENHDSHFILKSKNVNDQEISVQSLHGGLYEPPINVTPFKDEIR